MSGGEEAELRPMQFGTEQRQPVEEGSPNAEPTLMNAAHGGEAGEREATPRNAPHGRDATENA